MKGRVLLIAEDSHVLQATQGACDELSCSLTAVHSIAEAEQAIERIEVEAVLIDMSRTRGRSIQDFQRLRIRWPRLCAILLAERADSEQAIEAMKHGAIDYVLKPLDHETLVSHIARTIRINREMTVPTVYEQPPRDVPGDRIIGQSQMMHEVFKQIGLIAPRDVNVLITGESGTGKELVARALYQHSLRKDRPFLAVNCAAIPETLLESELFGHEKGAFTGADTRRIGKFEQCHHGTLFLDEIGDLPLSTQAKLLRVLQDGSFQRLGSAETIHCDVRILAASNQPLEKLIEERRFREDLYYRLQVTSIHLPPLRDREVDVVLLAHYFSRRFNREFGTQMRRFSPEVLPALLSYPWPGNVRELENVVKSALVTGRGTVFQLEFLPERVRNAPRGTDRMLVPGSSTASAAAQTEIEPEPIVDAPLDVLCRELLARTDVHGQLHKQAVLTAERAIIRACLEQTGGQLAPAARLLGITRTTLRRKMTELGLAVRTSVLPEE